MIRRGRRETVLVILTVLAIGAGVVAGMVVSRLPAAATGAPNGGAASPASTAPQSALAEELHLSSRQSEQMRQIWEGVRDKVRSSYENAERLQRQRDEGIQALLTPEQKAKFEKLTQDYSDRFTALRRDRDAAFAQAVEQTRKLLADDQRQKYDELLKAMVRPDQLSATTTTTAAPVR
jgi:Spy/CpxP family protein refolding chaperone